MMKPEDEKLARELREQVNNLMAALQLLTPLVREQGGQREESCLGIMSQGLYRLMRTIRHMELGGEGETAYRPETLDLAGLCLELGRAVEPLAEQAGVSFRCELEEETLLTAADGELVEMALLNLIANALAAAAGPEGHVSLRLSRKGALALLTVRDDGPGLEPETEQEDPFLKKRGGLGLGLTAARRAAALHGGALVLENREEGGVRAVLSLPIRYEKGQVVRSPRMGFDRVGGFSAVLVELSPVLPHRVFLPETLE